jgi:alpha-tubulin suppressor-like RCC1 family protein
MLFDRPRTHLRRALITASALAAFLLAEPVSADNVVWTNAVGATASGSSVSKVGGVEAWDSGAVSSKGIASADGYVEFTAAGYAHTACGLSNGDTDQTPADIDFAIQLMSWTQVYVYESGVLRGAFGNYQIGDRFRLSVESGVVTYRKNGEVFYTSGVAPSYPLLVDTSLYYPGSQLKDVVISGVLQPVAAEEPVFSVPSGTYQAAQNVVVVTGTPGAEIHYTTTGVDPTPVDPIIASGASVLVDHSLVLKARAWASGLFPSAVTTARYASGVSPTVEDVVWTNVVKAAASGNNLSKVSGIEAWDAGAVSSKGIVSVDGYVEFTAAGYAHTACGLSNGDTDQSYADIDFAIQLVSWAQVYVYESGMLRGAFGSYEVGDRFRVSVESGVVTYRKNGVVFYTSGMAPSYPLMVDTALYYPGSQLGDVVISGVLEQQAAAAPVFSVPSGTYATAQDVTISAATAGASIHYTTNGVDPTEADPEVPSGSSVLVDRTLTLKARAWAAGLLPSAVTTGRYAIGVSPTVESVVWTNVVRASANGNNLSKTGGVDAWDSGAVSSKGIVSVDGYVEFTAAGATNAACGLSAGDTDQGYPDIDFAIVLSSWTQVYVYEAGVLRGAFGNYVSGDRFRVSVEAGVVTYRKNGEVFFTSAMAPSYPLLVDTALYHVGSLLRDVVIAGVLEPVAAAAPVFSVPSGTYATAQDVTITVTTAGAQIHYTTNGIDPTEADPQVASGSSVLVDHTLTLKARAWAPGLFPSAVTTGRYAIGVSPTVEDVVWTNVVAASTAGNDLSKAGGVDAWDAGAVSSKGIVSVDGYVEFTAGSIANMHCGLSQADTDQGYPDIDFSIFMSSWTQLYVYESGVFRGAFGNYQAGDRFRVSVESGVVTYRRNGVVFYTSGMAPRYPLLVDTALYHVGSQLMDVVIAGVLEPVTAAPPVFSVPAGTYATAQDVAITAATAGAEIHYTTNGIDPTLADPIVASGSSVLVDHSLTLKARTWANGYLPSTITTATYVINQTLAAPTLDPSGGAFHRAVTVTVICSPEGLENPLVHYRTDGPEPGESDPAVACGGTVVVARTVRLAAKLFAGQASSDTTFGDYSVTPLVAAGSGHLVLLRTDGTLWAWGQNGFGQLGDGTHDSRTDPVEVALAGVISIAAGGRHTLALKEDGTVWAWGDNADGQLGDGTNTSRALPTQVSGLTGVVELAAGDSHTLARKQDGTVWAWGDNTDGQLGDGTNQSSNVPVPVTGLTGVVQLAAGLRHSLARRSDGSAFAWGDNTVGQLGDGTWEARNVPTQVSGLTSVSFIAAGDRHSLAIPTAGVLMGWGDGSKNQIGGLFHEPTNVPGEVRIHISCEGSGGGAPSSTDLRLVEGGGDHTVAMLVDEPYGLVTWGGTEEPACIALGSLHLVVTDDIVQASSSGADNLAVARGGAVYHWRQAAGPGDVTALIDPNHGGGFLTFAPIFSPPGGLYFTEQVVTITAPTPGSTIHYTTDEETPDETSPTIPSGGTIAITQSTYLQAIAYAPGRPPSQLRAAQYTLSVAAPVLSPPPGGYDAPVEVTVTMTTPDVTMHYKVDGFPTEADPVIASGATITVTPPMSVNILARRAGWLSSFLFGDYRLGVVTPVITPAGGSYASAVTVSISTTTPGATLRYTTDGNPPTEISPVIESGGTLRVDRSLTIQARGWRDGLEPSSLAVETYRFALPAPTVIGVRSATADSPLYVTGASPVAGATVRCTTDGSEPTTVSRICTRPVPLSHSAAVKAKTFMAGWDPSSTSERSFAVAGGAVEAPVFSLEGASYPTRRQVHISTTTPLAVIRYTTDGTDPTEASAVVPAEGAIWIDGSLTLKARAWLAAEPSLISREDYLLSGAVTAGNTVVALRTDGTVSAWGANDCGQVGNGTPSFGEFTPVSAQIDSVVAIASGLAHTVALRSDGTVWTWGANDQGQLGVGNVELGCQATPTGLPLSNVVTVAAGDAFSVAAGSDGTLWIWGSPSPDATPEEFLAAFSPRQVPGVHCSKLFANGRALVCVEHDGQTWATRNIWNPLTPIEGSVGISGLALGFTGEAAALVTNGARKGAVTRLSFLWNGGPSRAELPLASAITQNVLLSSRATPFSVSDLPLSSGLYSSASWLVGEPGPALTEASPGVAVAPWTVVRADGTLWRWGLNVFGQLGDGTQLDRTDAAPVAGVQLFTDGWPLADADGDGLTNVEELDLGTDPLRADTNGDGIPDGVSVAMGRDPVSVDLDGDGFSNAEELARGLNPLSADTDGDGVNDALDAFPLDPSRWDPPTPQPGDTTPPSIILMSPRNAVLISSTP